jgi:hypothetical protein
MAAMEVTSTVRVRRATPTTGAIMDLPLSEVVCCIAQTACELRRLQLHAPNRTAQLSGDVPILTPDSEGME